MSKINYGLDAPKVINRLIIIGLLIILISIFFPIVKISKFEIITSGFIWMGISLALAGILMIFYSKYGKLRHRDRILSKFEWKGNEKVLDIGTGLGLLMIGVAKKLTTGKAYGIDIFDKKDLTNNSYERIKANVQLENVASKVEILKENILKTDFPNDFFDVIVSNLCLHNIGESENRKIACAEIHRIIKPKGQVIISDFRNIAEYIRTFKVLGMEVHKEGTYFFDTFPPLTIIKATKN